MFDRFNQLNADQAAKEIAASTEQAFAWLKKLQTGEGFRLFAGDETSLLGTCAGVLLLEGLQKLEAMPAASRLGWARYIQGRQDPETGLFGGQENEPANRPGLKLFDSSSSYRDTYFALHALDALESQARYPLRFLEGVVGPGGEASWLARHDWEQPALLAESLMFILTFFIFRAELEGDTASARLYLETLEELQTREDPETGFLRMPDWGSPSTMTANSVHLFPFFEYVHRPLLHLSRKVDLLLSLPGADGGDLSGAGSDLAETLAAVPMLAALHRKTGYRADEIHERLEGSWQALLSRPKGWEEMSILDAWLWLGALAAAGSALWIDFPLQDLWSFRRRPAFGFFQPEGGLSKHERRVLPGWIRSQRTYAGSPAAAVPAVSVILPCYNLGVYLPEAVDSVMAQTWQDFEIIVVDDGSTDEFTRLMLDTLERPRMQVVHQPNGGIGAARNLGISLAQGKYICCLDADDRLLPAFLERAAGILDQQQAVGFVTSFYRVFGEREESVVNPTCGFPELLVENRAIVSSLFRKEAWSQVGGYWEKFTTPGFEDWDLWISLMEAGWDCAVIPEELFEYRIRPGSMYQAALRDPERLRETMKELVHRHSGTFNRYTADVIAGLRVNAADLLQWISKQDEAKAWWEGQAKNWRAMAQEREIAMAEQKAWIEDLQEGKEWLEEQLESWKRIAADREQQILALRNGSTNWSAGSAEWKTGLTAGSNNLVDPAEWDYTNTPASPSRPGFSYLQLGLTDVPQVTIITPYHNTGPVFHQTARTVLGQSFQTWEWLIINDGSSDPTALDILQKYRTWDPRIRVIDHPENQGLSAARNTGFRSARTPYIVQLDSDDLLEPTAVEKWYWFLQSYPEYSFVKGYTVGFGAQEYLWRRGYEAGKTFLEENQVDATGMVRRGVHQAVGGYDESNRGGLEDWDFWLKCASQGFWGATIPEFLDWYRRRSVHSDRWGNWSYAKGHSAFRDQLRQRYPQLWKRGFPQIQPRWHMPNETVPVELPCENRLQKKKPRILMVIPWLRFGGADKFNLNLLEQLRRQDWEVTIATTAQGDHSWLSVFARHTPDIFILSHFLRLTDYPRFLRYLVQSRQVDLVLISNSELAYVLLPYLRHYCPDTPLIDYCHMEEEGWKSGGYPRMSVEYQEMLDLNLVSSEHLKSWMVQRGAEAGRVRVCTTNIDPEKWHGDFQVRKQVRQELGIPDNLPVILYTARICPQKQPAVFAKTMLQLRQRGSPFIALAAGDGPDFHWLESFVKSQKLENQVRLLGPVSNHRIWELMCAADIFFLPSKWEGIALSIYEAMACGLPIISARVGGQAELVTATCGMLIEPGAEEDEIQGYADILATLLLDGSKRKEMGQAARERVVKHFPIDQMGEQMVDAFRQGVRLHKEQPRPHPSSGLARACAAEAIEYTRLFQLADQLWLEKNATGQTSEAGWKQRNRPNLRTRLYLKLYQWHEPYYRWYSSRGLTWLDPIRNRLKRIFLQ